MLNKKQQQIIRALEKEGIKNLLRYDVYDQNDKYVCVTNGHLALAKGNFKDTENKMFKSIYNDLNSKKRLEGKTNITTVSIKNFKEALKGERENIRLIFTEDYFYIANENNNVLYSQKSENNKAEEVLLNVQYLRKILNFIPTGNVIIELYGEFKQVVFRQVSYNCLLLPIRDFNKNTDFIKTLKSI